jgi:hypothetical protein
LRPWPVALRTSNPPGTEAGTGLDAGAQCALGFSRQHEEGLSGSCAVPASGGAATCLVFCTELFHRRHHHHGFGFGWGGPGEAHGGPWWKHGSQDAGTAAP